MKIRKLDLQSLLYQVSGLSVDHPVAMGIIRALEYNTLEIDGYERVQWTRFDPSDPKTFPPKTDEYIVAIEGRSTSTTRKYSAQYSEFFAPEKITHWRPLPEPPVETEAGK